MWDFIVSVRGALIAASMGVAAAGCVATPPEPMDQLSAVSQAASQLAPGQVRPQWHLSLSGDAADILAYLDEERVLVGNLVSPDIHALPQHGPLSLVDARTGTLLWSTPRINLSTGHYRLLTTQPVILLHGIDGNTNLFMAIDPATGRVVWTHKALGATVAAVTNQGDGVFITSRQALGGLSIARLAFATGKGWSTTLSPQTEHEDDAPWILHDTRRVYSVGVSIAAFDALRGGLLWKMVPGSGRGPVSTQLLESGLLWADAGHMVLLEPASGKLRWRVKTSTQTAMLAADNTRVYRLGRQAKGGHVIEAYAMASGRKLWSRNMASRLASGLAPAGKQLWFSDTDTLRALDTATGEVIAQANFSRWFADLGPYEFTRGGQLDILVIGDDRIEVVRERAGVVAVAPGTGRVLWEQKLLPGSDAYVVSSKTNLIQTIPLPRAFEGATARLRALGAASQATAGSPGVPGVGSLTNYDSGLDHRIAQSNIVSSRTLLQSQIAHTQSMGVSTMDIVRARAEEGQKMQQIGMDLGRAVGQLIIAVRQARARVMSEQAQAGAEAKLSAWGEGKIQRYTMESLAAFDYHQDALRGGFLVRPYGFPVTPALVDGAGLTLVDLKTGKRSELVYAVTPFAQIFHGFNMPSYAVSPSGRQVLAVGIGLAPSHYETHVQWHTLLPRQSLMAYSVDALIFADEAPADIRQRVQPSAPAGDEDLSSHALTGRIGGVRRMLAAGAKPDATIMAFTPLAAAAYVADVAIVDLLLAHGANPNGVGQAGWTPLEAARQGQMLRDGAYAEIRKRLVAAGAKR